MPRPTREADVADAESVPEGARLCLPRSEPCLGGIRGEQSSRLLERHQVGSRIPHRHPDYLVADNRGRHESGFRAAQQRGIEALRPAHPRLVAKELPQRRLPKPDLEQAQGPLGHRPGVPGAVAEGHPGDRLPADQERVLVEGLLASLLGSRLTEALSPHPDRECHPRTGQGGSGRSPSQPSDWVSRERLTLTSDQKERNEPGTRPVKDP